MSHIHVMYSRCVCVQTSALGRTILGTEDDIKGMTRDRIVNYIQVRVLISCKVFIKLFCTSQFPHKSVNVSFTITDKENDGFCVN